MTKAEQETILRWAADDERVSIFTAHAPARRKIEKRGYVPVKVSRQKGAEVGWFYTIPRAEFRWRVGARKRAGRPFGQAPGTPA